jgi:tetratricopeptide (TPR) repeat protein
MNWDSLLQWITDHKDALGWLFGTGIVSALLGGLYKLIRWLVETRRERKRGGEGHPFTIIPPGGDVLAAALPDPLDSPLNDRRIPYVERLPGRSVRREMEDLLRQQRALLVCGKSGLGKTREAAHLAQMLSAEGWTVLYLPPDRWLEPPARRPEGVPDHKILLFLDDLSRRCGSGRREVNPRADSLAQPLTLPFQERLLKTLEALETFYGKGDLLVLATTRSETTPEYEGEPAEWDKLDWERYPALWERFARYDLPEPASEVAARLLTERGAAADIRVEQAETLARRNDGTFRNLIENLKSAANPQRGLPALTPETFRDTLRGTWAERYRRAVERYPEAQALYHAAALLRQYGFPLARFTLLPLGRALLQDRPLLVKWLRLPRALRYLERYEAILTPRDGQLEAAGPPQADREQVVQALIRLGERHRLAEALYTLAGELMWPDKQGSSVYHPDAMRILQKVTAWQPGNQGAWYRLGVALKNAGQKEEAIAAYQQAIQLDPKDAYPWNGLGNVYYDLVRHEEAIEAYQQAIALDPKYAYPWNGLGNVYSDLGRHEEAIAAYQQAIALDPKFAYPWHGLGNVYSDLGRHEEAIAAYQKAIQLDPKYAYPWNGLGIVYYTLGRHEEAIAAYHKALEIGGLNHHEQAVVHNGLGNVYHDLGRHEEAIAAYQKAIQLDPKYAAPWNGLGLLYENQEEYEKAIEHYRKALEIDPNFKWAYANLGNVYADLGRHEDAIAAFHKALEIGGLNPHEQAVVHNGLGNVYYDLVRHEEAIEAYQKAIQLDPNSESAAFAWNNLAGVYLEQRQFEAARHALQERIRLKPENTFAPLISLGVLTRHLGEAESDLHFQNALAQWDKAWRDRLQSPAGLLENKAIALLCLGRKEEALQTLREALAQRLPGDVIEWANYELLRAAPHPPEGIEEMIAVLKGA